jgi:hypothetical protein
LIEVYVAQALVSFKKYIPPPLPYFKVNIFPQFLGDLATDDNPT